MRLDEFSDPTDYIPNDADTIDLLECLRPALVHVWTAPRMQEKK